MADTTTPPAPKCPGWYHRYDEPNAGGACDLDRRAFQWLSSRRETTHQELEQYRTQQHGAAGLITPPTF